VGEAQPRVGRKELIVIFPKFCLLAGAFGCRGCLLGELSQNGKVAIGKSRLTFFDVTLFQLRQRIGPELSAEAALKIREFDNAYRRTS
jgi:hypothetical protein